MGQTSKNDKGVMRIMGTYIILMVLGLFVIVGIIKIQLVDRSMWLEMAEKYEADDITDEARRGNIYSSDGKIMATTIPVYDLYLDFGKQVKKSRNGEEVKDSNGVKVMIPMIKDSAYDARIDELCRLLASLERPGRDANYYRNRIETARKMDKASRCYLVERNLPYAMWDSIAHFGGWGSFVVKRMIGRDNVSKQSRVHIYGNLAKNCIGFSTGDISKSTGLEGYYDKILAGQDGLYECRRLAKGVWLPVSAKDEENLSANDTIAKDRQKRERIDGDDIIATIDTRYQDIAETALRQSLHRSGGTELSSGCAILMEAKTGYVLACSNLSWDSVTKEYMEMPDKNIACSDIYNPGSTIKTIILTAIMNDSSVVIDTAMPLKACVKRFNNREDSEIRDDHYLYKDKEKKIRKDTISLKEAMMISSNVGMCYLGWENYRNRRNDLRKQVEKIFPYEILNLDIRTGEYASKINDLTPDRDFLNYCYGYAQSISAMQLITFYNALANGGKMVKPLFCKAVVRNGEEHLVKPITLRESICSKENLKILNELLVNVVENGTGNNIRDNSYGIAGKTGTSICYGAKGYFNASFAGYFPAENPQYTCLVVVKHVPAYGRSAAAPVFKKISDCVVALDPNLENGKIEVGCHTGRKLLSVKHSKQKSALQSGMMPDCDGMTIREALKALEGLSVTFAGHGRVVKQSIPKGSKVKAGSKIHLTLENL